jgi:hypothetical protein
VLLVNNISDPECVDSETIVVGDFTNSSMTLNWQSPATPNGEITNYGVSYVDQCNSALRKVVNTTRGDLTLVELHPYTNYTLAVTPYTRVGPSLDTCGNVTQEKTRVGRESPAMNIHAYKHVYYCKIIL